MPGEESARNAATEPPNGRKVRASGNRTRPCRQTGEASVVFILLPKLRADLRLCVPIPGCPVQFRIRNLMHTTWSPHHGCLPSPLAARALSKGRDLAPERQPPARGRGGEVLGRRMQ